MVSYIAHPNMIRGLWESSCHHLIICYINDIVNERCREVINPRQSSDLYMRKQSWLPLLQIAAYCLMCAKPFFATGLFLGNNFHRRNVVCEVAEICVGFIVYTNGRMSVVFQKQSFICNQLRVKILAFISKYINHTIKGRWQFEELFIYKASIVLYQISTTWLLFCYYYLSVNDNNIPFFATFSASL